MGFSIDTSKYLHTYEAYRIPEGSSALNVENSSIVKSDGDSQLVLTEESKNQLIKDRLDYSTAMKAEQDKAYAAQQQEALKNTHLTRPRLLQFIGICQKVTLYQIPMKRN